MDYSRVIDEIFSQFTGPKFSIRLWDGKERFYGNGSENTFTLVIDDEATVRRLIAEGALGFGESYMDGKLRIEGDIEAYLRLRHQFKLVRSTWRLALASLLAKATSPYTRKAQIAQHYDLGNDFFEVLLDTETMSYSAGKYVEGDENLAEAQRNKFEYICTLLSLPNDANILDLGSGWGGFAFYAAKNKGWKTHGCTLSNAQLIYCKERAQVEGFDKQTSFEYRDIIEQFPTAKFDAIVSIESIEHIGKARLAAYFANTYAALRSGGSLYIQVTGRYTPHAVDPWTLKYVFPGGYLPAKDELLNAAKEAGFIIEEFRDDTSDYIRTMTTWIEHLEKNRAIIEQKFDPSFYRLWELWMHGAKVAFEVNSMNLFRIHLKRP